MLSILLALLTPPILPRVPAESVPPIVVPAPPLLRTLHTPPITAPTLPTAYIVELRPGQVSCDGAPVRAALLAEPLPIGATGVGPKQNILVPSYTLRFRIAADGRPLAISAATREPPSGPSIYFTAEDLEPALAASRFESGARVDCVITYAAFATPVATASLPQLFRFIALPRLGQHSWREAVNRVQQESGDCFRGEPPQVLLRAYPDFRRIPQAPGTMSWTVPGFDLDAAGTPTNIRTIAAGDNAVFNEAARVASAKSRYSAGPPRENCHYPYYRRQEQPIPPPPMPDRESVRIDGARCEVKPAAASPPRPTFPENFRRRAIEGWAIVSFDVAPWGEVGNVEVVESQPAAGFGVAASSLIRMGPRVASPVGATGCIERFRFAMADRNGAPAIND